ncbi:hypothetical protein DFH09DRAFT_1370402 [Mycena vulgaris]|nr:hypothetical protein DFH09DRAFT_1370402 [Mycena vulgaris]
MIGPVVQIFALAAFAVQFAAAAPALITIPVPVADPQITATAKVLGVDAQGRTTYLVEDVSTYFGTATVVAASDYFSLTAAYQDATTTEVQGNECKMSPGEAICVAIEGGVGVATATFSAGEIGSLVLDVATSLPPVTSSGSASATSAPTSQPTAKPNSSPRTSVSIFGALIGLAVAAYLN